MDSDACKIMRALVIYMLDHEGDNGDGLCAAA